MTEQRRHELVWRTLYGPLHALVNSKFNIKHDEVRVDGPCLLVSNHVSAWDPLIVAMSLKHKQLYYVASEHLFRMGFVSRALEYLVAPIPRRKASSGFETVKVCLRRLKDGQSVGLFAEGEQSWDGRTAPIFSATGKLAKSSGATLITYRIEGAYLSLPRWGHGIRRGEVRSGVVNVYSPEQLKTMTAKEVTAAIQRDISEDAWERQRQRPVRYRGKNLAEGIERAIYLCPACKKTNGLSSAGDTLSCSCGKHWRYTEYGTFDPPTPFRTIADWEDWQRVTLCEDDFVHETDDALFSDDDFVLTRVLPDHTDRPMGGGKLTQYPDRIVCGLRTFPLKDIDSMAMVLSHLLLLNVSGEYWQIRAQHDVNLRKYLALWRHSREGKK